MDLALSGLQSSQCLVYLDDLIILGRSFQEHLGNLQLVLEGLWQAGLKLKPIKCSLCQSKVKYLGNIVSREGIKPDPTNTEKVVNWPVPTTKKQVQQFLGMASYYIPPFHQRLCKHRKAPSSVNRFDPPTAKQHFCSSVNNCPPHPS